MSFYENTYLSWYIPKVLENVNPHEVDNTINLHSSGVTALGSNDFALAMGNNPYELPVRFEAALADWLDISPEEIIFTPGATGGNLIALLTLVESNQQVIVETPIYEPMFRQADRTADSDRLVRSFDDGWRLNLEQARHLINDNTGMIIITEPHNPSGTISPRNQVMELAALAAKSGAVLLINEVYRGFTDRPSYHGASDNIVIVNSLSKLFGTYWMRLGWLSAPNPIAEKLRLGRINTGLPTMPAAGLGLSVMEKAAVLQSKAVEISKQGFAIVNSWVENTEGVSWHAPQGIGFGCIKLPAQIDDVAFAEYLYKEKKVFVVPGTKFEAPGTLRISWLQSGDKLQEGLDLLAQGLGKFSVK